MAEVEVGWRELHPVRPGGFLARAQARAGLAPGPFRCFVSHADEVVAGAPGTADLLVHARSADCAVQAYRVRGLPLFGLQFHCELPLPEARELFVSRTGADRERWSLTRRGRMLQRAVDRADLWRALRGDFLARCRPDGQPVADAA